jgi:hypothetical protein
MFSSSQSVRNIEAVFFTRCSFLDRMRGKALHVPYVPASSGDPPP